MGRQGRQRERNLQNPHPLRLLVLERHGSACASVESKEPLPNFLCAASGTKIQDETKAPKTYETTQRPPS